jgi:hypothetical protein
MFETSHCYDSNPISNSNKFKALKNKLVVVLVYVHGQGHVVGLVHVHGHYKGCILLIFTKDLFLLLI